MKISWISSIKIAVAVVCAALAVVASPWFVEKFIALDHLLTKPLPFIVAASLLAALSILLLISAWKSRHARAPIQPRSAAHITITVLVSTALCALGAEIFVRTAVDPYRVFDGDTWWEYRWRQLHDASGEESITDSRYGFDRYDPILGWRPRENYSGDGVRTNSMGIRAEREFTIEPPGDVTARIVVVGDSYTWGERVRNGETYADRLDELLPGVEVINLGVHGYGTDQQFLYIREFGLRFKPDLVILGFFDLDIDRNVLAFRDYAKPRFMLDGSGELMLTNVPVPSPDEVLSRNQRLPRSYLFELARKAFSIHLGRTVLYERQRRREQTLTCAILDGAYRETKNAGAELLLVFIPWSLEEQLRSAEGLLERWAGSSGAPFLNLRKYMTTLPRERTEGLYGDPDEGGHWTPAGHRTAAEAIASTIIEKKLLPGEIRH
jgi:hypothetical protein